MRVLVTGGTGFTGSALVLHLLQEGYDVLAIDVKEGLRSDELRSAGAEVRLGTITDAGFIAQCMRGVGVVHHLAAAFRQPGAPDAHYYDVNVSGTRILLEAALRNDVGKFVHCSTCGVHGHVEDPPADEDAPIAPADYYQKTKYLGELVALKYVDRGLETVILRPAALYGPGDPGRFFMLYRYAQRGFFPMFGKGDVLYHPVYLENYLEASLSAMEPGRGVGRVYLVADEECPTLEGLVREVADVLGVDMRIRYFPLRPLIIAGHVTEKLTKPFGFAPPIFPRRVDWFRQTRAFDIGRAKRELGYEPRYTLREGLERTVEWYRSSGWLS